jgi:hypothetical protein
LEAAFPLEKHYAMIWKKYCNIDFRPARGYWKNWKDTKTLDNEKRKNMITACSIQYLCDTPTVICYLGGAYVSAHQDTEAILSYLQRIIDPATFTNLACIYHVGAPKHCNATAANENFWQAVRYGNHKSTGMEPSKRTKSIIKDCCRGYALSVNLLLLPYIPNAHVTPLGMGVDLDKRFKTPRIISPRAHPKSLKLAGQNVKSLRKKFTVKQKMAYLCQISVQRRLILVRPL